MSSHMVVLQDLTPREAIADALSRAETAFDYNDRELFDASVTDDFTFAMEGGHTYDKEESWNFVFAKDTTHFTSNVRINHVSGQDDAFITFTGLAQHYKKGSGKDLTAPYLLAGGLNTVHLIKDVGSTHELWKLQKWRVAAIWWQGDRSILY